MSYIRSPVTTICVGQAASMASLILAGGAAGQRFCLPHSSIMVHQPSGGFSGQASDIAIHAQEILRIRHQLNQIYQRHLTKPHSLDEIEQLLERDRFMGPDQACEMGLIDRVLQRRADQPGGVGSKSVETKSVEAKPVETKPDQTKPEEPKPAEGQPI